MSVGGRDRTHDHRVCSQRLILSRHTGRRTEEHLCETLRVQQFSAKFGLCSVIIDIIVWSTTKTFSKKKFKWSKIED